ncbi:hypothetical protein Trydic_g1463 [Trypoxylus dichotomus]
MAVVMLFYKVESVQLNSVLTDTASSMSPDPNHNELPENSEDIRQMMNGSVHKEAAVPEKVLNFHTQRPAKTGGTAEDIQNDFVSVKAAVGEQQQPEDDEKIQEYLQRSDTAVIYPEPVGRHVNDGRICASLKTSTRIQHMAEHICTHKFLCQG